MLDPTKAELLEILAQLGVVGYSERHSIDDLTEAIRGYGLSFEEIEAEVAEQRGRDIPGRPT